MKYGQGYVPSKYIRKTFIDFFVENNHYDLGPSSIIPNNDPTLLFINSGMAPLKDFFTGAATPPKPDLCNFQPCIRTGDIDDIGDRHHLSFFEMLGSWSINNYFKQRAIELAYGLLVDRFGIPPEKLYATVYGGNEKLGLPIDQESIDAWIGVGIPRERIVVLGDDNFWMAGDVGPCGPCTEVFMDTGPEFGPEYVPGGHFDDKSRYIEIWNAGVFMEFNRQADGTFSKLPFTSVDTGSGLERMEMALNGHPSAYETDLMKPQMDYIAGQLKGQISGDQLVRVQRQITDHMRTTTFMLGEGVAFSNEGRGYIPRRLARKSIALVTRHAPDPSKFNFDGLIGNVISSLGDAYPFLKEREDLIIGQFNQELKDFRRVIDKGMSLLEKRLGESKTLSGADAFELFATYGMPKDLLREFVAEKGAKMDEQGFDKKYVEHQEVSRASDGGVDSAAVKAKTDAYHALFAANNTPTTVFTGYNDADYNDLFTFGETALLIKDMKAVPSAKAGEEVILVADRTPFYGEGGGQIGDIGDISVQSENGGVKAARLTVKDTQKIAQGAEYHYLHFCTVDEGEVKQGDRIKLKVDSKRRQRIANNHSSTHLLQSALLAVLGKGIKQRGSIVTDEYTRFDFSYPQKVTPGQLAKIEQDVNRRIRANLEQVVSEVSYEEAMKLGAIAFTGDKYGDTVRVISFGTPSNNVSVELCGGTHVKRTGDIGYFKVLSEESVASGVRRIVATTGEAAVEYSLMNEQQLQNIAKMLSTPVDKLADRITDLQKNGGKKQEKVDFDLTQVAKNAKDVKGGKVAYLQTDLPANQLRENALQAADQIGGVVVLSSTDGNKASVVVAVAEPLTKSYDAGKILRELMPLVNGKGGGKARQAQGGGDNMAGLANMEKGLLATLAAA